MRQLTALLLFYLAFIEAPAFSNRVLAENPQASVGVNESAPLSESEGSSSPVKAKSKRKKPKPFGGFGKYKDQFVRICQSIEADGRKEVFSKAVETNIELAKDCRACRDLFKTFSTSCRGKKSRVSKGKKGAAKEEQAETKIPPRERLPSALVIDSISRLFSTLAAAEQEFEEYFQATARFTFVLRNETAQTAAEKEYFETMAEYTNASFVAYAEKLERAKLSKKATAAEKKRLESFQIDSLFEQ